MKMGSRNPKRSHSMTCSGGRPAGGSRSQPSTALSPARPTTDTTSALPRPAPQGREGQHRPGSGLRRQVPPASQGPPRTHQAPLGTPSPQSQLGALEPSSPSAPGLRTRLRTARLRHQTIAQLPAHGSPGHRGPGGGARGSCPQPRTPGPSFWSGRRFPLSLSDTWGFWLMSHLMKLFPGAAPDLNAKRKVTGGDRRSWPIEETGGDPPN